MAIYRTHDEEFIYQCATVPETWKAISDDYSPTPDMYFPNMHDSVYWLLAEEGGIKYGVFMFHQHNGICYEAHTILLPRAHGKATRLAQEAVAWMFEHTDCLRIITNVPKNNPLALRLAHHVGFKEIGVNQKSFMQNGVLLDQILLGLSKGE